MKIVPAADIGDLGPKQGTSVTYDWKWYYGAPTLTLWLALIAAFVFIKANRNPQALLILGPLLIANLLWLLFKSILVFNSADMEMFTLLFNSLAIGITVLWLLAHKLGDHHRFVTFLSALIIMGLPGLLGAVSYGMESSVETIAFVSVLAMLVFAFLLGFVLASWRCRKRYGPARFMLWLGLWTVTTAIVLMVAFASVVLMIQGRVMRYDEVLLEILTIGLVCGLGIYLIDLPYMILAFCSSFFRERFYACLRLKSMPHISGQADPQRQDASENAHAEERC